MTKYMTKQEQLKKLKEQDKDIDYTQPIWHHWLLLEHKDGTREEIMVVDQEGEDCRVYNEKDEMVAYLGDELKSWHIQLVK